MCGIFGIFVVDYGLYAVITCVTNTVKFYLFVFFHKFVVAQNVGSIEHPKQDRQKKYIKRKL